MPSTSHGGVRAEVRLGERRVGELVGDHHAALVGAAVAVGAPEHEHALARRRPVDALAPGPSVEYWVSATAVERA